YRDNTRNTIMYSRREFGRLALVGLPMTVAFAQGPSGINSKINGVRIGVQSYSFRGLSLDDAVKAMAEIGIGECELFSGHVEPRIGSPPGGGQRPPEAAGRTTPQGASPQGPGGGGMTPEMRRQRQEEMRKWRLTVSLDHFKNVRKKFDDAGIKLQAYNLSFNDNFTDEEIDRGFQMADTLGVKLITASSTLSSAKRAAPFSST